MEFRVSYSLLLCSLNILRCHAKLEFGSFRLKERNQMPSTAFFNSSSLSSIQCAATCNKRRNCASFAFERKGSKLCILSEVADGGKAADGFMHYVKRPGPTTTEELLATTVSSAGTTSQVTTKQTSNVQKLELNAETMNYLEAEKACRDVRMRLITIKTQSASNDLEKLINSSRQKKKIDCEFAWIGLTVASKSLQPFRWSDGENLNWPNIYKPAWTNWDAWEPGDFIKGEDQGCIRIVTNASNPTLKWRDTKCSRRYCFICE